MESLSTTEKITKMIYKDSKIEIDNMQIKFKNGVLIPFLIIFISMATFSFMFSNGNLLQLSGTAVGLIIGFLIIRLFVGMYLKNSIDLSSIDYVKRQIWDLSIDKNRNFWGTGQYEYHFPTGINKKTNPEVLFVHIKGRKAAVGFVPDNIENMISTLKEKGINIEDGTMTGD